MFCFSFMGVYTVDFSIFGSVFQHLLLQADAYPHGLNNCVDLDTELPKPMPRWNLLVTYTKDREYRMTAYRLARLFFESMSDQTYASQPVCIKLYVNSINFLCNNFL